MPPATTRCGERRPPPSFSLRFHRPRGKFNRTGAKTSSRSSRPSAPSSASPIAPSRAALRVRSVPPPRHVSSARRRARSHTRKYSPPDRWLRCEIVCEEAPSSTKSPVVPPAQLLLSSLSAPHSPPPPSQPVNGGILADARCRRYHIFPITMTDGRSSSVVAEEDGNALRDISVA